MSLGNNAYTPGQTFGVEFVLTAGIEEPSILETAVKRKEKKKKRFPQTAFWSFSSDCSSLSWFA